MGLFGNSLFTRARDKDRAREQRAQQQYLGALGIDYTQAAMDRTTAAEMGRLGVFSMLGAPGTFDRPGTTAVAQGVPTNIFQAQGGVSQAGLGLITPSGSQKLLDPKTGKKMKLGKDGTLSAGMIAALEGQGFRKHDLIDKKTGKPKKYKHLSPDMVAALEQSDARKDIIDPNAYAASIADSASFRIQSKLTADAEEMLAGEGPAWDMLNNAVIGSINENAALALRDDLRNLRDQAAKGGTARNVALQQARQTLAWEASNRTRAQETWKAGLELHNYVRENAARVQEGNYRFLDNLPMARHQYTNSMNKLSEFMTQISLPEAAARTKYGYEVVKETTLGAKQAFEKMLVGTSLALVGAAASAYGGGGVDTSFLAQATPQQPGTTTSPGGWQVDRGGGYQEMGPVGYNQLGGQASGVLARGTQGTGAGGFMGLMG